MHQAAFLWQGFEHTWLRSVMGFRLPHRISKLHNYIAEESFEGRAQAQLHVAQATGVDGNFMRPRGRFATLSAAGLQIVRRTLALSWSDEVISQPVPHAVSRPHASLQLSRSDVALSGDVRAVALLRGFELVTRCDPAKQPHDVPRNSDGIWPYELSLDLGPAEVDAIGWRWSPEVCIARGWTPNRGGIPGIEEKPLNHCHDYELKLHCTIVIGEPTLWAATTGHIEASGAARVLQPQQPQYTLTGEPGFPTAALGLRGFGFELLPPSASQRHQHRGRYIGGITLEAIPGRYDGRALEMAARLGVWVPKTVVASEQRCWLRPVLIQLAAGAVGESRCASGQVCNNSSPEAPFFSTWKGCGQAHRGPAQDHDKVAISGAD